MGFVKLSNMPSPPTSRVSDIRSLVGGLNIHDIPWQIGSDQSPEMKNMWWNDGALRNRPEQTTYNNGAIKPVTGATDADYPSAGYGYLYHGWYVFHCNGQFITLSEDLTYHHVIQQKGSTDAFSADFPIGTFFMHNDVLYYKAKGAYVAITVSDTYVEEMGVNALCAAPVEPYIPTILMNGDPMHKGAGDLYQPLNRLSNQRRVLFHAGPETDKVILPEFAETSSIVVEYLNLAGKWETLTGYEIVRSIVSAQVYIKFEGGIEEITEEGNNNLRVTYSVEDNDNLLDSIMDCDIAEVYGGGQGLCIVLAGCELQPNAYFWSGNTNVGMDPGYFPVEHYNLAGDASDPITAFGKQQSMLVIFQKSQIGRCTFSTSEVDGRTFVSMDYTVINPRIGCDLPKTVQLIENNLVFANTKRGVMLIKDTTSAYENNIVVLSTNVEKPVEQAGILYDLNTAPEQARSLDDGRRYWLCVHGHAWLWDYSLGGSVNDARKLSWFYFDAIQNPSCWFGFDDHRLCFLGFDGYFRQMASASADTFYEDGETWKTRGEDVEKIVTLPIQDFGTYEVLKNVNKAIFVVQGTGNAIIDIEYETDYETRMDRTPIITRGWSLVPRNLAWRSLKVFTFAVTAVRKPRCINVRHFLCRLKNSNRGEGMTFVSAQIYFTTQGVDR